MRILVLPLGSEGGGCIRRPSSPGARRGGGSLLFVGVGDGGGWWCGGGVLFIARSARKVYRATRLGAVNAFFVVGCFII